MGVVLGIASSYVLSAVLNWTTEVSTIAVVGYGKTVAGVETVLIPEARPGPDLAKR